MKSSDPIARVAVISTGSVAIRPEHVGPTRKSQTNWLLTSRTWTEPLPINVYVIEHERGLLLFDTGQDRASVTDPHYFPGGPLGAIYARLARFDIAEGDTLTRQLAAAGFDIADVRVAILSHLHQDHIGGLPELGHAEILVSEEELADTARRGAELRGLLRKHINLPGLRWKPIDFSPRSDVAPFVSGYDVFEDGSLVLLSTPGHTPGSMSLLVRRPGHAPLLLVGDLTYDVERMLRGDVPGSGDKAEMHRSSDLVAALRERMPDLVILAAHDPGAAAHLRTSLESATPAGS
ncbi:MAG: N-acyl homoserine lactone hydrolase [Actinomycetota bacterium]|jgi:glyoxylase-like metal-dependent hydrolase (beta-lactamase superfamily II)|nr:N-acyl homoserine lactone hydrolase [Actinomycetota bacterium]